MDNNCDFQDDSECFDMRLDEDDDTVIEHMKSTNTNRKKDTNRKKGNKTSEDREC